MSRLLTRESVDDDTEDQLHADNVDDEEDGDVVDPSDEVASSQIFRVTWSQEDISHRS